MADVQAKLEQGEIADRPGQEKAINDTEEDNTSVAAAEVAILNAEVDGQNDINKNNDGDINGGGMWELEDINVMETAVAAAEFLGGYDNVSGGGWGEWKHDDGGETWRECEFYADASNNYEDNDWVIDDLWVFDDNHQPNINGGDAAANPRDPQA